MGSAPWTRVDIASRGWQQKDIAFGTDKFVAVGNAGDRAIMVTSVDGLDWSPLPF